jgi:hypothetical protein
MPGNSIISVQKSSPASKCLSWSEHACQITEEEKFNGANLVSIDGEGL